HYSLPAASKVHMVVYNVLGQVVKTLVDEIQDGGYRETIWNAVNISSGFYFYRLDATRADEPSKTFTQIRKMVLIK
ncbi:MAG: hypothetical protein ACHQQQ_15455, partial [Bacteroidota bacterium]